MEGHRALGYAQQAARKSESNAAGQNRAKGRQWPQENRVTRAGSVDQSSLPEHYSNRDFWVSEEGLCRSEDDPRFNNSNRPGSNPRRSRSRSPSASSQQDDRQQGRKEATNQASAEKRKSA
eukprot:scaffold424139_cov48-Prasinocladus_malaysianus.AAC.1